MRQTEEKMQQSHHGMDKETFAEKKTQVVANNRQLWTPL